MSLEANTPGWRQQILTRSNDGDYKSSGSRDRETPEAMGRKQCPEKIVGPVRCATFLNPSTSSFIRISRFQSSASRAALDCIESRREGPATPLVLRVFKSCM
jgi:hypothetical protein